jgi:C-1 hydroxylase
VRRTGSTVLVLGLATACATAPTPSPGVARSEVLDAEQRFWRAVSRGDVDHAVRRVSEDAVFEAPDGSQVRGRIALGERLRRDAADRLEVLGVPDHVHVGSPELVVVTGSVRWTGTPPEGRRAGDLRYVDTWRWAGSGWRLVSASASPPLGDAEGSEVVRRVLDAWSSGDWRGVQALLAPGYRARPESGPGDGDELRRRFDAFHRTWASARFDVEEQFATGARIVTRITATLTEAGTGRTVRWDGIDISRVVDGQLVEHWESWEPLPAQTSWVVPVPTPEGARSTGAPD